jgi:nitrogen fixation NifU-like protein
MSYSEKVLDHADNPRNVGTLDKDDPNVGTGLVGAPACGDVMRLQIKVNADGVIEDAKFKTFGCGSAIAASSLATEWIKGKTVEEAAQIKNSEIVEELNLPPVKIHCSVLAEDAIKSAIEDYRNKQAAKKPKIMVYDTDIDEVIEMTMDEDDYQAMIEYEQQMEFEEHERRQRRRNDD